jgi:hypothetical protein
MQPIARSLYLFDRRLGQTAGFHAVLIAPRFKDGIAREASRCKTTAEGSSPPCGARGAYQIRSPASVSHAADENMQILKTIHTSETA